LVISLIRYSECGSFKRHFITSQIEENKKHAVTANKLVRWLWASAAKHIGTAHFWVITQRAVKNPYRRFGTTYRNRLQG